MQVIDVSFDGNPVTVLDQKVYSCRMYSISVRKFQTTLAPQRSTLTLSLQNSVRTDSTSPIEFLESFGGNVYAKYFSDALQPRLVSHRPGADGVEEYLESFSTEDLEDSEWLWAWVVRSILKRRPKYLVTANDANVYKLSGRALRRNNKLKRVPIKNVFVSSLWPFGGGWYSNGVGSYGEQDFVELLKLSLLRVVAKDGQVAVGDRSGNVFQLDGDDRLHLYGGDDQREVYDFGRLPIAERCFERRRRMWLDEERRLLFVWNSCHLFEVFSLSITT